jgi:hypothetical protein
MSATDGKPTPRPSRERAMWLLSSVSSVGRQRISSEQYEELRSEARAQRKQLRAMKGMHPILELPVDSAWPPADHDKVVEADRLLAEDAQAARTRDPRCCCPTVFLGGLADPCPVHS